MIVWSIFLILMLIIGINDFLFFRIEDENVLALIFLYAISCFLGISGNNLLMSLSVASGVFVLAFIMNQFNLIGGGDVKFLFPLVLFSENNLAELLLSVSISGLILALIYLFAREKVDKLRKIIIEKIPRNKMRLLNITLLSLNRIEMSRLVDDKNASAKKRRVLSFKSLMKQEIPYGVALSCGGIYVVFENLWAR